MNHAEHKLSSNTKQSFLLGGGEMGELIREKDWTKTALGDPEHWPHSLRTIISVILDNPFGMYIAWGTDYIQLYNDGYRPILGTTKHPQALGISTRETFAEIWHIIGPMFDDVMQGKAVGFPDFMLPLNRNGFVEECYFDFSYSPVRKENGEVGGVLVTVVETTNKKKAEEDLKLNKEELEFAIEAAKLGTWDYNPVTNKFTSNHRLKEWFGLPAQTEIELHHAINAIADKDRQRIVAAIEKTLDYHASGGNYEEEYSIINPVTKKEIIVHAKGRAWFDENKVAYRFNGTLEDVSEQVMAQRRIAADDKRFRNTLQQAPVGITILRGPDYMVEMANDAYLLLLDRKEAEFVGRPLFDSLPEVEETVKPLLDGVMSTGQPFHGIEYPIPVNRFGKTEVSYFDFLYHPLKEEGGKIDGIIVTVTDVTEKVKTRTKTEESEKEFRQLADSLPELVWTTDNAGNQTFASKRWKEYTGLDPYDITTFEKMVHPDDLENIIKTWTDCLTTGSIYKTQVRLISKTGDYQWFYVHGEPIKDEQGKIEKWVGSFTNFNVQKRAETELIRALVQIEESESRFRDVANTVPVLIWMAGSDRHRNFFNNGWLNFTGRSIEQESGDGWAVSIYPDDFEKCLSTYTEAFDQRKAYNMQYRLRRHDGEYRWISARGVPRFTASGSFEGFIGACMDIHEQVIYQQKLKEDEERLNIIIDASELGNWELDLETKEITYSDRYIEILGHAKGEILSHQQILKHLHPDDLNAREEAFKLAFDTGMLLYQSRIIWPNGSLHWIEGRGKVFYNEKHEPVKMIGTVRDITEEKNYQQQLKEREEKFRLLADSMPQHIWTADTAGNLNYFNKSVYDYSGLTPEQIHKEGWIQIVHEEEKEKNITEWLKSVSTGKNFLFEHRFRRHDGEYRWQLSRAIPQRDAAGNIQMWVGTSTDIQEIKEQDQQKDFFISMASHELKTPITSIKGYVQLLQSSYGNSEDAFLKSSLAVVEKQVLTLTRLISDLLDVSKIKLGNLVLNKQDFEITEMIQDVINHIQHINPDYSINFSGTNALVHADRERISQVLINLLTNAVKYSPNSKKIMVKNIIKDDQVTVFVQDSGIGINKADQEKIFERFYRVTGKDEKTYPGFGIGLFICSQIIERHQGKIGVTSEPGKGAVFYFSIPLNK